MVMKINTVNYSNNDILKMTYYFQNKSIYRIVKDWIKLNQDKKVYPVDIDTYKIDILNAVNKLKERYPNFEPVIDETFCELIS